jgi:hypothetical protein
VKIAFLVLSHRPPTQLLRLLRSIRSQLPESPVVVHHDVFCSAIDEADLAPFGNVHLVTSAQPVGWGDYSLVDSCWKALEWMGDHLDFDWVILLSAQDYPIKPLNSLQEYLRNLDADALLRARPISELPEAQRLHARQRYFYHYRPSRLRPGRDRAALIRTVARRTLKLPVDIFNNIQPWLAIYKFPDGIPWRLGYRAHRTPFTRQEPCWFGSAWFGLSRRAVDYLVEYVHEHPEYVQHLRHTVCPDESATATVICNARQLKVEPRDMHFVRWTHPESGHPDVLTADDLQLLAASPAFFARKFDIAKDAKILDELDALMALRVSDLPAHSRGTGPAD